MAIDVNQAEKDGKFVVAIGADGEALNQPGGGGGGGGTQDVNVTNETLFIGTVSPITANIVNLAIPIMQGPNDISGAEVPITVRAPRNSTGHELPIAIRAGLNSNGLTVPVVVGTDIDANGHGIGVAVKNPIDTTGAIIPIDIEAAGGVFSGVQENFAKQETILLSSNQPMATCITDIATKIAALETNPGNGQYKYTVQMIADALGVFDSIMSIFYYTAPT